MKARLLLIILTLTLASFIVGCALQNEPKLTPSMAPNPSLLAGSSQNPIVTSTPTMIATFNKTGSATKSTLSTNTLIPIITLLPTFSTEQARNILGRLVQVNGGCRLPCVMGLTPGKSDRTAVNSFMGYFQDHAQETDNRLDNVNVSSYLQNGEGGIGLMFYQNNVNVQIGIDYLMNENIVKNITLIGEAKYISITQDGVGITAKKLFGNLYYNELLRSFSLSQILNTYGTPEQVILLPFPDYPHRPSPPAQYPFNFVLFYPDQGFIIEYIAERREQNGNYIGCPTQSNAINISAWDPSSSLTLAEAVKYFSNTDGINSENWVTYKPIQDISNLDIIHFSDIFKDPTSHVCVASKKDAWPTQEP